MSNPLSKTVVNIKNHCALISIIYTLSSCNCRSNTQHIVKKDDSNSSFEYPISDSNHFQHIKNEFYSNDGHLFQRTFAQREFPNVDTVVSIEYFNGRIPQDIDPLSFKVLDGWFAKDKNSVYYYRPTSDGMQISKIPEADAATFKVLDGDYRYGVDKSHVFEELKTIVGLKATNLIVKRNKKGYITELRNENFVNKVEPVGN